MPDDPKDDIEKSLQKRLEKHGNDAMALAASLHTENFQEREKNRTLTNRITALEQAQPAEGSVVLSKTEAERYEAYKALGKPDELVKLKTEHAELQSRVAKAERDNTLRAVAEVSGYEFDVLTDLVTDEMAFEIKPVKEGDKEIKRAFVTVESNGKKETQSLKEYADSNERWKKYKSVLEKAEEVKGTPYVPQRKGEPPKPPDAIEAAKGKLISSGKYQPL